MSQWPAPYQQVAQRHISHWRSAVSAIGAAPYQPVAQRRVPEQRNPQTHHCENSVV